jgi:hypothetical protein
MAQDGNPEPLEYFVSSKMLDEADQVADLNYWAYWLGEVSQSFGDDHEMVEGASNTWVGDDMARHLLTRLAPDSAYSVLTVRSLWSLLALRPDILKRRPDIRALARTRVEMNLDSGLLSGESRQQLASVAYAVRLAGR